MHFPYRLGAPFRYARFRGAALKATVKELVSKVETPEGLPLPPPALRQRVHGNFKAESYLKVSKRVAEDVRMLFNSVGYDLDSFQRVLDFGCGSGRLLRKLGDLQGELHGTDIDGEAIDWCCKNLPFAKSAVNGALPPTSYPDDFFDCIIAISVFTHLDEKMQFVWLAELQRITKPGGALLLSVHGKVAQSKSTDDLKNSVTDDGVRFVVGDTGTFKRTALPDFYQNAYHARAYIEREWPRYFEILGYVEAGINGHQDAVLLRKVG